MKTNKQNYFSTIWILIIIAMVLIIALFIIRSKGSEKNNNFESSYTGEVNVIDSDGQAPIESQTNVNDTKNSAEQGAATLNDLGGSSNSPASIESLLKDKEIQIK